MKKENNIVELFKGIGMFLLFFILPILLQLPFIGIVKKCNNIVKSLILLGIEIIVVIFYIYMNREKFKGAFKDFKENKKEYSDLIIKSWLLGFIGMFISNLLINVIFNFGIASNEEANRNVLKNLYIYAIPAMSFLGPIVEELAFRGSFKKALKNKKVFLIVTTLLFAGAHLTLTSMKDLLYIIPYSSLGFAMGYVYCKTDNILTNISLHIFHNSLTLLLYLLIL